MVGTNGAVDHTFPDAREFDIRRCCRMFANCSTKTPANGLVVGNMNVWNPTIGGGGTITLEPDYENGGSPAQYFTFVVPPTTGNRIALSDRVGGNNSNLLAGQFEMDCTARVRWAKDNRDETVPRIGFTQGHITYVPTYEASPNPFNSCIAFTNYGDETTWFAHLCVNGSSWIPGEGFIGPIAFERRVNTNVPVDVWNTLHVWVSRDGRQVDFFANGVLVHRETDPAFIPRRDNFAGADITQELGSVSGGTCNNGGFTLRGQQLNGAGLARPVDIDWIRVRYFPKR